MAKLKLGADVAALNPGITDARLPGASKYGAKKAEYGGLVFDSQAEARRYQKLVLLEQAGEIARLETQVVYSLRVEGIFIADYVADFRYFQGGRTVVEDVKGVRTPAYAIKKKLLLALHGISILETEAGA